MVAIWKVEKYCYDGKERVNKTVLRCFLKTGRDADDVTESGKLFHARAAATETVRLPGRSVQLLHPNFYDGDILLPIVALGLKDLSAK